MTESSIYLCPVPNCGFASEWMGILYHLDDGRDAAHQKEARDAHETLMQFRIENERRYIHQHCKLAEKER